jgi:hypothetical protein
MVHGSVVRGLTLAGVLSVAIAACTGEEPGGLGNLDGPWRHRPRHSSPTVRSSPSPERKNFVSPSWPSAVVGSAVSGHAFHSLLHRPGGVAFDRSWWDLVPGSTEGQFGFTFTRGTMTLDAGWNGGLPGRFGGESSVRQAGVPLRGREQALEVATGPGPRPIPLARPRKTVASKASYGGGVGQSRPPVTMRGPVEEKPPRRH